MHLRNYILQILIGGTVLSAGYAQAENSVDYFNMDLADLLEIKVQSASLFPESVQHAAASIERIDERDWQRWGARSNIDAISHFNSTQAYPTLFGGHAIAIRGYSQFLSVRGVATLIDGVPVNDVMFGSGQYNHEHITLGVVDSLELIKGPGSTLYGSDAFHGVLQFNSYYAEQDEFKLHGSLGDPQYHQLNWKTSLQWLPGHYVNLAADTREQGQEDWSYFNKNSQSEAQRPYTLQNNSLNVKFHNAQQQGLRYKFTGHYSGTQGEGFVGGGESFNYQVNDVSDADQHIDLVNLDVGYYTNLSGFGLKHYSWQTHRDNSFEIGSGIFLQHHRITKESWQGYWRTEQARSRLYVGLESSKQIIKQSTTDILNQDGSVSSSFATAHQGYNRKILSLFAQGRHELIADKFAIEGGIRFDDYDAFGLQKTPRLAAIYNVDEEETFKFIYSTAFRAATALEIFDSTAIKGSPNIRPEELSSYELVWFKQYKHCAHQITLFHNDWQEGIVSVASSDPNFDSEFVNSGANQAHGLEAEFRFKSDDWYFDWRTSFVHSENTRENMDYSMFPSFSTNFDLDYSVNRKLKVGGVLWFKDGWKASGQDGASNLSSYQRLDINALYLINKQLRVSVAVKNLTGRNNRTPSILNVSEGELEPLKQTFDMSLSYQF